MRAVPDSSASVALAVALTEQALAAGADLVVLPENFAGIGRAEDRTRWAFDSADPGRSPALAPLLELSTTNHAWIVAGGTPERIPNDPQRTYNTLLVLRRGRVVATYRKIHLFDADLPEARLQERDHTAPGRTPVVVQTEHGGLGLSICYDLRFPELYRALCAAGAELLVVPSAFTLQTGLAHWEPLLRARAIENQAWVLAAAQWGIHATGRHSYGHSMVVDPWGTVVAQASEGDGVVLARLDPEVSVRARARLPSVRPHLARPPKMNPVRLVGSGRADEPEAVA
jgi:deaminated glutathione amidase